MGYKYCVILIIANFYYIDNVYYLKAEIITERSINLWNRVLSRIEETDGYRKKMPFMIASSDSFYEDREKNNNEFSPVILPGYDQGYAGYLEMNIYPEDGSVKIIDGVMVVNFDAPIAAEISYSPENKYLTLQCVTGERLADEDFSYVWYIYHNGSKIDTVYTQDEVCNYYIDESGKYRALLFTKDPQEQYSVQRQSDTITVEISRNY